MKALEHVIFENGLPRGITAFLYSSLTPLRVADETRVYFSDAPKHSPQLLLTEEHLYMRSDESHLHALRLPLHRIQKIDTFEKEKQGPSLKFTCPSTICHNRLATEDASEAFMVTFTVSKKDKHAPRTAKEEFGLFRQRILDAYARAPRSTLQTTAIPACFATIAKTYCHNLDSVGLPVGFSISVPVLKDSDLARRVQRLSECWIHQTSFKKEQHRFLRTQEYERALLASPESATGTMGTTGPLTKSAQTIGLASRQALETLNVCTMATSRLDDLREQPGACTLAISNNGSKNMGNMYDQGMIFRRIQPFDLSVDITDLLWSFLSVKSSTVAHSVDDKDAFVHELMSIIGSYVAASPFYIQQRSLRYVLLPIDEVFAAVNRSRPNNPVRIEALLDIVDHLEKQYRTPKSPTYAALPAYLPWKINNHIYMVNKDVRYNKTLDIFILVTIYSEFSRRRELKCSGALKGSVHPCIRADDLSKTVCISVVTAADVLDNLEKRCLLASEVVGGIKYYYLDRITLTYRAMMHDLEKKGLI